MSHEAYSWMMFALFVSMAVMVVVRFAFYGRKENGMSSVYFWGGCLSFSLAAADPISRVAYGTDLHHWQTLFFFALTAACLYISAKKRRVVSVNAQA